MLLSGVRWRMFFVYLEQITIFFEDQESHGDHINHIRTLLGNAGVKVKLKPCSVFEQELD